MSTDLARGPSLLMIPGPIEISPGVAQATCRVPASHVSPELIADFGKALADLRRVWRAGDDSQPFVVAGSGTLAMEMAATNLLDPGQHAVVANSGYFSDRMAEMLRRRGVRVTEVQAAIGDAPTPEAVAAALQGDTAALFVTHVDTSTGVRVDPAPLCRLARDRNVLSVFDGVCAVGAERFEMAAWDADVVLTASQKAIGLPVGLALLVASPRALAARARLRTPPPLYLDWQSWLPILQAYEQGRPSYFATPATTLLPALRVGLEELLAEGPDPAAAMDRVVARHQRVADAMRAAWSVLGLQLVPARPDLAANTLSALRFPDGVGPDLPQRIARHGVTVAGGLHPEIRTRYFRVGHMGYATTQPEWLVRTVQAVGQALAEAGHRADVEGAVAALQAKLAA